MATHNGTPSQEEAEHTRHGGEEEPWEHASASHSWLDRYLSRSSPVLDLQSDESYRQFFEEQLRMDLLFGNVSETFAELARYNNSLPPPREPVQFCRCEEHGDHTHADEGSGR